MVGNPHFDALVANAPFASQYITESTATRLNWGNYTEGLTSTMSDPADVVAVSWCSLSHQPIHFGASAGQGGLAAVSPRGIYVSTGDRSRIGKKLKADGLYFDQCKEFSAQDWQGEQRGDGGKYTIEFLAAGAVLLGRLEWVWWDKRFRDPRPAMIAAATERDRILTVVTETLHR